MTDPSRQTRVILYSPRCKHHRPSQRHPRLTLKIHTIFAQEIPTQHTDRMPQAMPKMGMKRKTTMPKERRFLVASTTNAMLKCNASSADVGIPADIATMRLKITISTENAHRICCAWHAEHLKRLRIIAMSARQRQHVTIVISASFGIIIARRRYTIVQTAVYAEEVKGWARTSTTAKTAMCASRSLVLQPTNVILAPWTMIVRFAAITFSRLLQPSYLCRAGITYTKDATTRTWKQHINVQYAKRAQCAWTCNGRSLHRRSKVSRCLSNLQIHVLSFSAMTALPSLQSSTTGWGTSVPAVILITPTKCVF